MWANVLRKTQEFWRDKNVVPFTQWDLTNTNVTDAAL